MKKDKNRIGKIGKSLVEDLLNEMNINTATPSNAKSNETKIIVLDQNKKPKTNIQVRTTTNGRIWLITPEELEKNHIDAYVFVNIKSMVCENEFFVLSIQDVLNYVKRPSQPDKMSIHLQDITKYKDNWGILK